MRWIVRKVVEYVIDALLESDKLDDLLVKVGKNIVIPGGASGFISGTRATLEQKANVADDIDSTGEIAKMIISRSSDVKMSDVSGGSEEITESEGDSAGVMDMLKNIGD